MADPGNKLVKFADDNYLVIPASGVYCRKMELDNIETWAPKNNLTLKTEEVIFSDMLEETEGYHSITTTYATISRVN